MRLMNGLSLLLICMKCWLANANTSYIYKVEGHSVYEIVVADNSKDSSLSSGIYKIDKKTGNSQLLISGNVNGVNKSYSGILASLSKDNGRKSTHCILTLIDGNLVLLNYNSDSQKPGSIMYVGKSGKNGLVLEDIINGSEINLPPITNLDDVNIALGDWVPESAKYPNGGRLVLISVKAQTPIGTGITFGVIVDGGVEAADKIDILNGKGYVLGYDFLEQTGLQRMFDLVNSTGLKTNLGYDLPIVAPSLASRHRRFISRNDDSLSNAWAIQLKKLEGYIQDGFSKNVKLDYNDVLVGVPVLDLLSLNEAVPKIPVEVIVQFRNLALIQFTNPVTIQSQLGFVSINNILSTQIAQTKLFYLNNFGASISAIQSAKINKHPKTGKYLIFSSWNYKSEDLQYRNDNEISYIFTSGEKTYYLAKNARTNEYQSINLSDFNISPDDSLYFFSDSVSLKYNNSNVHVLFIAHKSALSKKMKIYVYCITDGDRFTIMDSRQIFEGEPITQKEMALRIIPSSAGSNPDIFVDVVTSTRGIKDYLKSKNQSANADKDKDNNNDSSSSLSQKSIKTVPYYSVASGLKVPYRGNGVSLFPANQVYLKPLVERPLIHGKLWFLDYDLQGAKNNKAGFYWKHEDVRNSVGGYPLLSAKDKSSHDVTHIMYSKELASASDALVKKPEVLISLVPFVRHHEKVLTKPVQQWIEEQSRNKFSMGLFVSAGDSDANSNFEFLNFDFEYPFKSLVYAKIIQGSKISSDEFYVLFFFKADPEIAGSKDAVLAASGKISWSSTGNRQNMNVGVTTPQKIHSSLVPPEKVNEHLAQDAKGAFYWLTEPSEEGSISKGKIRKLSAPNETLDSRGGAFKNLRAVASSSEDGNGENDIGFGSNRSFYSSKWEIYSAFGIEKEIPEFKEYRDKKSKKEDADSDTGEDATKTKTYQNAEDGLLNSFRDYLDKQVIGGTSEQRNHPRIFVVEPDLQQKFKMILLDRIAGEKEIIGLKNHRLALYYADSSLDDVEVSYELSHIANSKSEKPRILYVDNSWLASANGNEIITRSIDEDEDEDEISGKDVSNRSKTGLPFYGEGFEYGRFSGNEPYPFASIETDENANLLTLLASNGKAKSIKGLKKLRDVKSTLPMISIMNSDEWRNFQAVNALQVAAGALNSFEINYDYMTSAWTLWPPNTEKTAPEIKEMAKVPYKPEEMRIFPTLDKILNEAATGQLKGKQKILIVPPELKALIQKLILLRWSAADRGSAGVWHYSNSELSLNKIFAGAVNSQSMIQDSFRAMRGAADTRHSVLYSDLETIERIGRPTGGEASTLFRIRDPIQTSKGLLLEREVNSFESDPVPLAPETNEVVYKDLTDGESDDEEVNELRSSLEEVEGEIEGLSDEIAELKSDLRSKDYDKDQKEDIKIDIQHKQKILSDAQSRRAGVVAQLAEKNPGYTDPNSEDTDADFKSANDKSAYPHMLWMLAAEGQNIQPKRRKNWNLKDEANLKLATILVGTEEELERLESALSFEEKFFKIRNHFDITNLDSPDETTKFKLVEQLFERPEVNALGITFLLKNDNGKEPRSQLIYHFINRIEQLAYEQKIEKTSAFIRAYVALKNSLAEDLDLRAHRTIDERFIERIFTRVFPMPLNPEILETSDPLNRLKDVERSARELQAAGYQGSQDLKKRFFENILSQTRPTDTSRPIPNSQILYGGTSTGKTLLLVTLFKMLGLTEYNRNKGNNDDADYIFINCAKIVEKKTNEPDKISIDEVIADILDLMSGPKGARASIVFDDIHKASSKVVRERLSQFIQGLFEAKNGMHLVKSKDGKRYREIPVQNLNLYVTLNPTANESHRKQFVKDSHKGSELLKREVLAALSGEGFSPEESFLARWSDIINLDLFPRSAKVPELVKRVRQNASRSNGNLVLVDHFVIDSLIDAFPDAHAREFLSPATAALTSLPSSVIRAPMYLVSLPQDAQIDNNKSSDLVTNDLIKATVSKITQIDPIVVGEPKSLLNLMGFIMRNFRLSVFNNLSIEAHVSDQLKLNIPGQTNLLKTQFVLGVSTHVLDNSRIPVAELKIRPEDFSFFNRSQVDELIHLHALQPKSPYFPISIDLRSSADELNLEKFIDGRFGQEIIAQNKRDVLIKSTAKLEQILRRSIKIYLRLSDGIELQDLGSLTSDQISNWFYSIPEKEPDEAFKKLVAEIIDGFYEFQIDLASASGNLEGFNDANIYDQVRLYSYTIDKAISRIPWGPIAQFTLSIAEASNDFSLGTRATFREFVGTQQLSPYAIVTPEFMNDMYSIAESGLSSEMKNKVPWMRDNIKTICETLMSSNGVANAH